MPDFDKNLKPITKDISTPDFTIDARGVKNVVIPSGSQTSMPDLSKKPSVFDKMEQYASIQNPGEVRPSVTSAELAANQRYGTYNPMLESQEDFAAYGQEDWKKAVNAILKGTVIAGTTVAGSFAMVGGAIGSLFTQKISTIWDNPGTRLLDDINKKLDDEILPNYYTNVEKNAKWWETDNWFKTNFLFDKLIKNSGYAIGAMYGGNIANSFLLGAGKNLGGFLSAQAAKESFKLFAPTLKNAARLFSAGENAKAAEILTKEISSIADIQNVSSELANIAKGFNTFANKGESIRRGIVAAYSTAGEASFEALSTGEDYRNSLIDKHKLENNGQEPTGADLEAIEEKTRQVGLTSFLGNIAILGVTEYLQLPKLLGSNFDASRNVYKSFAGQARDVIMRDGKYEALEATTKFGKLYDKTIGVGKYLFDPKEAIQENLQYALQIGTQHYFNKGYRTNSAQNLIDSIIYSFVGKDETGKEVGSLVSKEGMESALLGGITGALMQASGNYSEDKRTKSATSTFVSELNNSPTFKNAFIDKVNSINRGVMLQQDKQSSVVQGDVLEYKDLEADEFHNYLNPRIKYGRFDMIMDDINDIRNEASTEKGLANLKSQGIGTIDDTIESFRDKVNHLESVAKNINLIQEYVNNNYGTKLNNNGKPIYNNLLLDKLVYSSYKVSDYDLRIPKVNKILLENNINTTDVLKSIIEKGEPNKEATEEALKQIDEITKNSIITKKDELKTALSDVIELSLRRNLFLSEYNDMAENPENYELPDDEAEQQTVEINQVKKEDDKIENVKSKLDVGKRYNLNDPILLDDKGSILDNPKLKVLSKTLGGEYEVELPDGSITFLSDKDFEKYELLKEGDSKLINESIDEAISILESKYRGLEIEKQSNKLEYIKSLNNSDVAKDLQKVAREIYKNKIKEITEKEELKKDLKNKANELDSEQNTFTANSSDTYTPDYDPSLKFGDESARKLTNELFNSTTLPSEKTVGSLDVHVVNHEKFVNNLDGLEDRSDYKIILVPGANESDYGLEGLTDVAWKKTSAIDDNNDPRKSDIDKGLIAAVYVKKIGNDYYYVNSDNVVGNKVGEVTNIADIVFSTMPSTELVWPSTNEKRYRYPKDVNGKPLDKNGEKFLDELMIGISEGWRNLRKKLIESKLDLQKLKVFDFKLSSGHPVTIPNQVLKSSIKDIFNIDDSLIESLEDLIQIGTISGISYNNTVYNIPDGRVVLTYGNKIQYLQNRKFNKNEASTLFLIVNNLAETLKNKRKIDFNSDEYSYLRSVLFWKNTTSKFAKNQIYIDFKNLTVKLGDESFDLIDFEKNKDKFIDAINDKVYMSINNKNLLDKSTKFAEPYVDNLGNLQYKIWPNYQSYLLKDSNPDGSSRSIPLTLNIAKPTTSVPYSFEQIYATIPDIGQEIIEEYKQTLVTNEETFETESTVESTEIQQDDYVEDFGDTINNDYVEDFGDEVDLTTSSSNTTDIDIDEKTSLNVNENETTNNSEPPINPNKPLGFIDPFNNDEYRIVNKNENKSKRITSSDELFFKKWAAKNLPNMSYTYLENMIKVHGTNKLAWGRLVNGAIEIVKGGLKGTEYHETWEYVEKGFLSDQEINDLNKEFRSRKGTFIDRESGKTYKYNDPNVTDKMIKERRADDFSEYALGKLPAKNLSDKIKNFFKSIIDFVKNLFKNKSLQDKLFKDLYYGKYANKKFNVNKLKAKPEYRIASELDINVEFELIQYIKAMFFRGMFSNNVSLFSTEQNAKEIFNIIKTTLVNQGYSEETVNKLINETKLNLASEKIEFQDDEKLTINSEDVTNRNYAADAFSVDFKKSSPFAIKLLGSSLIRLRYNEANVAEPVKSKILETFQLVPYNEVYAVLSKNLTGLISIDDIVSRLYQLSKMDATYRTLFSRLGGNLSTGKIDFENYDEIKYRLLTQFVQVFTKQNPELIIQNTSEFGTFIGTASFSKASQQVESEWLNNIVTSAKLKKSEGIIKYDSSYKTFSVNKDLLESISGKSTTNEKLEFLNKLGITFTQKTLNDLKEINELNSFNEAFLGFIKDLKNGDSILKYIVRGNNFKSEIGSNLSRLAELYSKVTSISFNSSTSNAEGKTQQIYTDSNHYANFVYFLNSAKNLDELYKVIPQLKDIFSKNSIIISKFFNTLGKRKNNDKLRLKVINGIYNEETDKGKSISKLNLNDRRIVELNQNLNGNYYILLPADSSTEWMLSLGNNIDFKSVNRFIKNYKTDNTIFEIYKNYLFDEINLVLDYENRSQFKNVKPRAKELRFFKDLLNLTKEGTRVISEINKIVDNKNELDLSEINSKIEKLLNSEDVKIAINTGLFEYITNTTDVLIDEFTTSNAIKENSNRTYNFESLDKNVTARLIDKVDLKNLSEENLKNIINYLNLNYVTNNIEIHKLLFGDPYQFKISEKGGKVTLDETKRTKSFGSPGKNLINFTSYNNYFTQFRNKINSKLKLETSDIGYHAYKNYIRTAVVNDIEVTGSLYNGETLTNEADAQSWMSPGLYREVKDRIGQWDDEAEEFYQWQMAYARQKLSQKKSSDGKFLYVYKNDQLKSHDRELISKPANNYKIEVLKPVTSGYISNSNEMVTLLDKMSQFPIFYKSVEGTNLEKLFLKMFNEKIDYIVPTSARKEGVTTPFDLYKDGKFNNDQFTKDNILDVPLESYRIQLDNIYVDKKGTTMGSQLPKIITSNLYDSGKPISDKAIELVNNHDRALEDLYNDGYNKFLDELGIIDQGDHFEILNDKKVAETLKNEFIKRGMSKNSLESINIDIFSNKFKIPFEASNNYVYIRRLLYSMLDSKVLSQKLNGLSAVQISSTLWESEDRGLAIKNENNKYEKITRDEYEKLDDSKKKNVVITSNTLKFYENEDGKRYCEILIPLTPELKNVFKDTNKFPDEKSILKYMNDNLEESLFGIGFRIPTQALNSIERFKIAGFLPSFMGKSVVVPSEITTKAGSDFDIDKLNIYLKSIFMDKDGKIKLYKLDKSKSKEENLEMFKEQHDELYKLKLINKLIYANNDDYSDIIDELSEIESGEIENEKLIKLRDTYAKNAYTKALQNQYYESIESILDSSENFDKLTSVNNTDTLISTSNSILDLLKYDESNIKNRLLDRNYMSKLRHMFLVGKAWVGIVALHITNHSHTQKTGTYVDNKNFNLTLPHNSIDINGDSYVSVSGIYDSTKKYITENLSELVNAIVDIAKDPYIVNIIYSSQIVDTMMFLIRSGVSIEDASYFLQQPIIKKAVTLADNVKGNLINLLTFEKEPTQFYNEIVSEFESNIILDKYNPKNLKNNIETYYQNRQLFTKEQKREQILILNEFRKILKAAEALSELNSASSFDTAYIRSAEQFRRLELKTINQEGKSPNDIKMSSFYKVRDNTFLKSLYDILSNANDALGTLLKFNKTDFRNLINNILIKYQSNKYISNDDKELIENMVVGSLLDFIIRKGTSINVNVLFDANNKNSVISLFDEYKKNNPGSILASILQIYSEKGNQTPTIRLKVKWENNSYQEDYYVGVMRSLKVENPQLFNALLNLSIVQGTNQTRNTIRPIIPFEDYSQKIADIIREEVSANTEEYGKFMNNFLFLRNNYLNDKIVPKIRLSGNPVGYDNEITTYSFNGLKYLDNSESVENSYLLLHQNSRFSKYNIVVLPRIIETNGEYVDSFERMTITEQDFRDSYKTGSNIYNQVIGYQLVLNNGIPYKIKDSYVYKPINLYGDGKSIVEYPLNGEPSQLNSSVKKVKEFSDTDIIKSIQDRVIFENNRNLESAKKLKESLENSKNLEEESVEAEQGISEKDMFNNIFNITQPASVVDTSNKINIYAGTGENAELSNFAIRPFTINVETPSGEKEFTFQSVEQGFHFYKSIVAENPTVGKKILETTNGSTLRNLTNRNNLPMTPSQVKEWDDTSKSIMLNLMYDSYVQNPKEASKLLATGNAKITHTQDNTRWKADFPEVVTTVRDMLKEEGFGKVAIKNTIKVISKDYGVVTVETNPSKEFDQKIADNIFKDVKENAYVENGSKTSQRMWGNGLMWKGNNTKNPKGKPLKVIPAKVDYNANGKLSTVNSKFFYDPLYNDGTPVAPITNLDFLKRHIENSLGIDMSGYDVSLNNIYEEGHDLFRHTDIDESNTAKGYPVIVYVFGNDHKVRFDDNNGKRTLGNMVNPKTLTLKNGDIYTFGLDGKGRFETVHDVVKSPKTNDNFPELIGADGKPTRKYTVTFTFRRAADLEASMPSTPSKISGSQPQVSTSTREFTPDKVTELPANGVFVFGSNTEGRHSLGAARNAKDLFGAKQFQPTGLQGQSYAIITKNLTKGVEFDGITWDKTGEKSVSLEYIGKGIQQMLLFAKANSDKKFYVTKLGVNLAGYSETEIKGLFERLRKFIPDNVVLPKEFEVRETITPVTNTSSVLGNIKLNIIEDWVKTGQATTTVRNDSYHNSFYKGDGVYSTDSGNLVNIQYKGLVKLEGENIVGNGFSYTKNEFAKAEGFGDWTNFEKNAKYAGKTLMNGDSVHLYNISSINQNPIEKSNIETIETPIIEKTNKDKNEFSYKDNTIETEFELTSDQDNALKKLIDFVENDSQKFITLQGAAGTGKTTIIGYLQKMMRGYNFVYMAPTHAATAELAFATVKTGNKQLPSTVASSLHVNEKENTYGFSKKFQNKLSYGKNIIVLDEVSMLSSKDYNDLIKVIEKDNRMKVIFMGDILQIPEVTKENSSSENYKKLSSKAFSEHEQVILNEVKRTSNNSILKVLTNIRKNINNKIPIVKIANEEVKKLFYLNFDKFSTELVNKFKESLENTIYIGYTNASVKSTNEKIRKSLGYEDEPVIGDLIIGYSGYNSKQIEKQNIANSIRYKITNLNKLGSVYLITGESSKLENLEKLNVKKVKKNAYGEYHQLSETDSLKFDDLTETDFEKNNKEISRVMKDLYNAKKRAIETKGQNNNGVYWQAFEATKSIVSNYFEKVLLGDDYIYNPTTDKMEKYNSIIHKNIYPELKVEKGIDYGYAITIHKSQGATYKNVFFDANTLPKGDVAKIYNNGKQITTEKHSLLYVGMSRASDSLYVNNDYANNFYDPEVNQTNQLLSSSNIDENFMEIFETSAKSYNKNVNIEESVNSLTDINNKIEELNQQLKVTKDMLSFQKISLQLESLIKERNKIQDSEGSELNKKCK